MTDTNVVPITNHMTEAELDATLDRIRETYGGSKREAGARYEQELARAFHRSGWTQEALANKVGVARGQLAKMLLFGRFLDFVPTGTKSNSVLADLSVWKFHTKWLQTDKAEGNERKRFTVVLDLLKSNSTLAKDKVAKALGDLAKDIAAGEFADGKWHDLAKVQEAFDETKDVADAALEKLVTNKTYKCKLERKPAGTSYKFRIFREHDNVSVVELVEKLSPIIEELKKLGGRDRARYSPLQITGAAMQLQNLIDEWRQ